MADAEGGGGGDGGAAVGRQSSLKSMEDMMASFYGVQEADTSQDATDIDASGFDAAMMVKVRFCVHRCSVFTYNGARKKSGT